MSKYQGTKHVTRTLTYRLKTSTRLTAYFDSMESESHVWLNAGLQAKNIGATFIDCVVLAKKNGKTQNEWIDITASSSVESWLWKTGGSKDMVICKE